MWRSGLDDLSGVSTMHGFFSKHQSFSLALAHFQELGNVTWGFNMLPFELVKWLMGISPMSSSKCIFSHAELNYISKEWTKTSQRHDFHYEIGVSFQRLCFFFCYHICQSFFFFLQIYCNCFYFLRNWSGFGASHDLYYLNVSCEQRMVFLKSCLAQEPSNLTYCFSGQNNSYIIEWSVFHCQKEK